MIRMSATDVSRTGNEDLTIRSRRVIILLAGIVLLSAADLAITLTYLTSIGFMEANPIAAYVITTTDSPWMLAFFKTVTVAIAVGVLFCLRRLQLGEIAAWTGMAILVGVAFMWHGYCNELAQPEAMMIAQSTIDADSWLILD